MLYLLAKLKVLAARRPATCIGMPLSLAVGLSLYLVTASSIEADARQRFGGHAQNARNTITARIKSYTDLARGAASVLQVMHPMTNKQFYNYVKGLDLPRNFHAIEAINFAEYVRPEERERFMQRMNASFPNEGQALPAFSIKPPGQRDSYSVTTLIEPMPQRRDSIGWDLQAHPLLRSSYLHMRDNGRLAASGMPVRTLSTRDSAVLALRVPVYAVDAPVATVEQRRQAFLGSMGIAFSVNRLLTGVLDEMPVKNARMMLVDNNIGPDLVKGRVLFDSTRGVSSASAWPGLPATSFSHTLPIDFHGRQWDATFSADPRDIYSGFEEFMPWLAMLAGSVSSMLLYALFHALASSRRHALKMAKGMTRELRENQVKLQLSHQNLRRLAAHADRIKENERKRIAREIHDDLGQNLLALRIDADMLFNRTRQHHARLHERARATLLHIDATIKSVRQIINDLRPNVLDLGLSAAVEWQVAEFRRRAGIACELVDEPHNGLIDEQAETAFFRILQESLSNVVRHAQASQVHVALRMVNGSLTMTVSDNGVGLGSTGGRKVGSFGLVGIEERIAILGGSFSIESAEGAGTTVSVSVPLRPRPPDPEAACALKQPIGECL